MPVTATVVLANLALYTFSVTTLNGMVCKHTTAKSLHLQVSMSISLLAMLAVSCDITYYFSFQGSCNSTGYFKLPTSHTGRHLCTYQKHSQAT